MRFLQTRFEEGNAPDLRGQLTSMPSSLMEAPTSLLFVVWK